MAARQTSNQPTQFRVEEFLNSGWVFGLKDGRIAIGWGEAEWTAQANEELPSIYAPDFYLKTEKPWFTTLNASILTRAQLEALLPTSISRPEISWLEPDRIDFERPFTHLKAAFADELATKGVPVVFARGESRLQHAMDGMPIGGSVLWLLKQALKAPPTVRLYGVWSQSTAGIFGLTPEVLFERYGNTLKSMALAGTKRGPLTPESEASFLSDEKERYEHQLVVDGIRESLSRFGTVELGEVGLLRLPTLAHLMTPVAVEVSDTVLFQDVVASLHPTPALGVAPRKLGLDWMKTWDQPDLRERFGAPFGLKMRGAQECLVAIRNVQWRDSNHERMWQLGSGCGVVPQSQLENEWQELFAKRQSVRKLLDI